MSTRQTMHRHGHGLYRWSLLIKRQGDARWHDITGFHDVDAAFDYAGGIVIPAYRRARKKVSLAVRDNHTGGLAKITQY